MAERWYYTELGDLIEKYCKMESISLREKKVLELGCGSGRGLEEIGKRFEMGTWGYSLEKITASINIKMKEDVYKDIQYLTENFFGLVLAVNFLEYPVYDIGIKQKNIKKAQEFMRGVARVMGQGGILAVYEPKTYLAEISSLIRSAGLRIVHYKDAGGTHTAFYLLARKF